MDNRFRSFLSGERSRLLYGAVAVLVAAVILAPLIIYFTCRIEVKTGEMAVLIKKTGKNLPNDQEIAPSKEYKGVQMAVLGEGRYFRDPWSWDWEVVDQVDIPPGKLGVRIRLHGDDLPYGDIIAEEENQKGILRDVLRPGRYPYNALVIDGATGQPIPETERHNDSYAEHIELHDPVTIMAGYKGVVTYLSAPMPDDPNVMLVESGKRGVQEKTLDPGTYYFNPYVTRVNLVDCRSQRFNLADGGDMGFPSKDGFWVSLDGSIEFRVKPEEAARVFVMYNEDEPDGDDGDSHYDSLNKEIVDKVILPNARAFCRLRGSDHSGREFISGDTRTQFQKDFQKTLEEKCESHGIEIIQALITKINPPQPIAEPVRQRQISLQKLDQYKKQKAQQISEQQFAVEKEMVKQKQALVEAQREVVKITTAAERKQEVAVIEANQQLKVAEVELAAAENLASAMRDRGKADAEVIEFANAAEAAGWKKAVDAFGGDGDEYARYVLLKKLAPSYRSMMINTADSPIMDIFRQYQTTQKPSTEIPPPVTQTANP
jgi:regulator of protease activity HflC (stomatin/prohibitin superfamily)